MGMTKRIFIYSSEEEPPLDKIRRLEKQNYELEVERNKKEKQVQVVLDFLQKIKDEADEYSKNHRRGFTL